MKRIWLWAVVVSSLLLTAPAFAEVRHQDPGGVGFPDGTFGASCWDCVISLSQGYKCESEFNGFNACQSGNTYTTDEFGYPVVTPFCQVVPYGACFTVTP